MSEWLLFEKCKVEHVANGLEAVELLDFSGFDLIILDWDLPGMDGVGVCSQFRSAGGTTPVLMLTGKASLGSSSTLPDEP